MELAAHIREHRTRLGLSQEDLAERLLVSRQTISNWETDRTYPDVRNLLLLSALFDTSLDELIQGDVAAMEKQCAHDRVILKRLGAGMAAAVILAIAAAVIALQELGQGWGTHAVPTFVLAAVLYGIGMALAFWCEHLKKAHDLVTYREIVDFWEGKPIDREGKRSQSARKHRALKAVACVLAGAVVGAAVGALFELAFPLG